MVNNSSLRKFKFETHSNTYTFKYHPNFACENTSTRFYLTFYRHGTLKNKKKKKKYES